MSLPHGHEFVRVELERGRHRLLCECGWMSPAFERMRDVGDAWDRHLDEADPAPN
jgi:hypothetical protein